MVPSGATYPSLVDRIVLVTGGGSGIGASIVRHFARQRAKVAFVDIDLRASEQVVALCAVEGAKVHFEPCDLRDIAALKREAPRDRSADAATAAGDDGLLAFEFKIHRGSSVLGAPPR